MSMNKLYILAVFIVGIVVFAGLASAKTDLSCGGIARETCSENYYCDYDGSKIAPFPDASGKCKPVKIMPIPIEKTTVKKDVKNETKETREEIKTRTRETTRAFKEELEQKKEELKKKIEQKREELKTTIETKREELKQHLEKIKDEKKKQAVERIDKQIDELNSRLLKHYLNVLDKISAVLVKVSERADKAEERGVDVSAVRTAITSAESAIAVARSAIEAQTGKTYIIQVNTEGTLKTDVGKARQALHNDLSKVRLAVKAAHNAVRNTATTLAHSMGVIKSPSPTVSPTPTP